MKKNSFKVFQNCNKQLAPELPPSSFSSFEGTSLDWLDVPCSVWCFCKYSKNESFHSQRTNLLYKDAFNANFFFSLSDIIIFVLIMIYLIETICNFMKRHFSLSYCLIVKLVLCIRLSYNRFYKIIVKILWATQIVYI